MRAITVIPGRAGSARLDDVPEPVGAAGDVLVDGLALGICGTDGEIVRGEYGWAPPSEERLVLGHESLGRVLEAPEGCGFAAGDLVVGIVRRPDPVPCAPCGAGLANSQQGLEGSVLCDKPWQPYLSCADMSEGGSRHVRSRGLPGRQGPDDQSAW